MNSHQETGKGKFWEHLRFRDLNFKGGTEQILCGDDRMADSDPGPDYF